MTLAAHVSLGTFPIYKWGNERLRKAYVPKLIAGEYMGAYGLTEPNAGSDAGGTQTTAVRDGDSYVLNGAKCFITNANYAGTFIVTAVTEPGIGAKGISAFVVPRDTPGFTIEKGEEKLGMRGSDWASLVFQDARIPKDHLLGPEGEGFKTFMKTLDGGRISIGALVARHRAGRVRRRAALRTGASKPSASSSATCRPCSSSSRTWRSTSRRRAISSTTPRV